MSFGIRDMGDLDGGCHPRRWHEAPTAELFGLVERGSKVWDGDVEREVALDSAVGWLDPAADARLAGRDLTIMVGIVSVDRPIEK